MKGVVFNVVEEFVTSQWSSDVWDDLLDDAAVDGAYTTLGTYPDEDLQALVAAASARFEMEPDDLLRVVGQYAFSGLGRRYPHFVEGHDGARTFLPTVNDIIHPEVLKLMPGATLPEFAIDQGDDGVMSMTYSSPRDLCLLAEGLILGAGDHFGEDLEVHQSSCRHRGDTSCVIVIDGARP
jgi:hypothetical protein